MKTQKNQYLIDENDENEEEIELLTENEKLET